MIRFIYADQLSQYPVLAESMFRDRAAQFKHRLDWEVTVDENGWEVDQYDQLNPLYIIWENAEGRHGGSVRIMPTVGRIMTNEHFLDLTGGVQHPQPADLGVHPLLPGAGRAGGSRGGAAGCRGRARPALRAGAGGGRDLLEDAAALPPHRLGARRHRQPRRGRATEIAVGLWPISAEARARDLAQVRDPAVGHRALVRRELPGAVRRGAHRRLRMASDRRRGGQGSDAGARLPLPARGGKRQAGGPWTTRRIRRGRGTASWRCCMPRGSIWPRRRCFPTAGARSRRWR